MSFGSTRGGEAVLYRERLDELRKVLAQEGRLGLLLIDVSPLVQVERDYGPGAFQGVLAAANRIILELGGRGVRGSDFVSLTDHAGDAFLIFVSPAREGGGPRIRELRAMAERVEGQLGRRLAALDSPCVPGLQEAVVGFGLALANPLLRPERQVEQLIDDVRECVRIRRREREFQNRCRLQEILLEDQVTTVFQPVVNLKSSTALGYEALSRGPLGTSYECPVTLFERAAECDLVFELDRTCRDRGLLAARGLPADVKLFLNVIPSSLYDPGFQGEALLQRLRELGLAPEQVVLEITEKYAIENYPLFVEALEKLTGRGLSVAVDDIGAGYSGFEKIVRLKPRYLKFDIELVHDIDASYARREMARALKSFADRMGSKVIAEGIERDEERQALIELGIEYGQGFLFGPPASGFSTPAATQSRSEGPAPAAPEAYA